MTHSNLDREHSNQHDDACRTMRDQFVEYIASVASGSPEQGTFTELERHVTTCSDCAAMLDEVLAITQAAYRGEVEAVGMYPTPDLGFLPIREESAITVPPWSVDHLGRVLVTFSRQLLDSIRLPQMTRATRGMAAMPNTVLYQYVQASSEPQGLSVTIEVSQVHDTPTLTNIVVGVDLAEAGPLEQHENSITLRWGETVLQDETDDTGTATFSGIPLDVVQDIRIEITPRTS